MTEAAQNLVAAAQTGDKEAQEILLREHTPLVWSVAKRFFGRGCEADDLFQLGCIGLLKAVRDFDLTRPVAFSTYAVPKIAGEIRRFLRDDGPVKVSRTLRERAALVMQTQARLERQIGQSPRLSDLCRETGLSQEEVLEALNAPRDTDSLDEPLPGQARTLGETLADGGGESRWVESLAVRQAVEGLEPRLRQIILLRYLRDMTQQRVAMVLGITQVQVSRLEKKARLQLQDALRE